MKTKAKSRLQSINQNSDSKYFVATPQEKIKSSPVKSSKSIFLKIGSRLIILISGLPFFILTFLILTKIPPQKIQNFLIPNSYLPFLISLFFSSFFIFFATLKKFLTSIIISSVGCFLLLTKFQNLNFSKTFLILVFISIVLILLIESLIIKIKEYSKK